MLDLKIKLMTNSNHLMSIFKFKVHRDTMKHSMNAKNVHKLVNAFSETLI